MKSKKEFIKAEIDEIKKLIRIKVTSSTNEQKRIRDKIRKIGFYYSEFSSKKGYTLKDFEALLDDGSIKVKESQKSKRLDTKLESEGAEFLVLGQLLINKIAAYKTYTNMPGYDLVAVNPERNTSAKIQVKSRWKTNAPGFLIKSFECDFVVVVKLNRGSKDGKKEVFPPEFYIFPKDIIEAVPRTKDWNKVMFKDIPNMDSYKETWGIIKDFLIELDN